MVIPREPPNFGGRRRDYTQVSQEKLRDKDIVHASRKSRFRFGIRVIRINSYIGVVITSEASNEVPTRTNSVMTEQLSRRTARWKYNTGEDAGYLQLDEKTPEALLQLDIDCVFRMRSVDGRIWSLSFGIDGSASEIPFFRHTQSNRGGKNVARQYLAGSFSGALSF